MELTAIGAPRRVAPAPLQPGDKVAILTPSSSCDSSKIDAGIDTLRKWGYVPVVMPFTYGSEYGSYSGTPEERAQALLQALEDDDIKAILCSRGGYGANHLLDIIDVKDIKKHPKWLIGYSDISILNALWLKAGVQSVHGPMTGHMRDERADDPAVLHLRQLLETGKMPTYHSDAGHQYNHPGTAEGTLIGGNMIVVNNLAQTPYDVFALAKKEPCILFIEDVGEKIYAVERMLVRLYQSGILENVKGLIIGKYSEYKPDADYHSMEEMFHRNLQRWGFYSSESKMPIVFDFPTGHVTENYPLVVGAQVTLTVGPRGDWTLESK